MKIVNVLEDIKAEDVISIMIDKGICSGKPIICVETESDGEIQQGITTAFELHWCNEFLRSLNLMPSERVFFTSYPLYCLTVEHLNRLLEIKRAMEMVIGKPYTEIGILASQVYQIILNRLLAKHHFASKGFDAAMQKRPMAEWVKEAFTQQIF